MIVEKQGVASSQSSRLGAVEPVPTLADSAVSAAADGQGLVIHRRHTRAGLHPFDAIEWELRSAAITSDTGEVVFKQDDVEVPAFWSQMATNVVVSKYFKGAVGTPQRESSVRQLVGRVADTIARWGRECGYFADDESADAFHAELTHLLLLQKMAFNSPVWFNVGIEPRPQASACFINSVTDSMGSIMELARAEAMLFKYGSGTGTNLSPLRGSKERLSTGGVASGPVSFMRGFDAFAGVIKSGGKTRRAAKMVILDADHPDIVEFIECKEREEKKAWALIDAGYDGSLNGDAYGSVFFQNSNNSVRLPDALMESYLADGEWQTTARTDGRVVDTYKARDLMQRIAKSAWACGDPGVQFDTTIQHWNPCSNSARINATNPCVTGDTLVATAHGPRRIDTLLETPVEVVGADGQLHAVPPAFATGVKPVYRLRTRAGYELTLTGDHRVLTANRGDVPACELTRDDRVVLGQPRFGRERVDERIAEFIGLLVGDGCLSGDPQTYAVLTLAPSERGVARHVNDRLSAWKAEHAADGRAARDIEVGESPTTLRLSTGARCVVDEVRRLAVCDEGSAEKRFTDAVFGLDRSAVAALLRGLYTADGTVACYGEKSQYVGLDSTSMVLLQQVQQLLLGFGIKSKLYRDRRPLGQTTALLPDGKGGRKEYPVAQIHSLRVSRSSRLAFEREIGFLAASDKAAALAELNREVGTYADRLDDAVEGIEFVGEAPVFDLTESQTHHFVANGLVVHNCSEFVFLDDTSCNLASLNLMRFRHPDGTFDVEDYRHALGVTILAQEIIVDNASYPREIIARNSHDFRPLGIGYANLGALLMARGLPYDSDAARALAGALTAVLTGEAYRTSAMVARAMGPFPAYQKNREPFQRVMRQHHDAVAKIDARHVPADLLAAARGTWADVVSFSDSWGVKNAQASVIAPTGTIAFMMDCDTTGVEPDIALVKYKKLVGGGVLKIVNQTVPEALERLGYDATKRKQILAHIESNGTIEGAPGLKSEHLPVFDCAFKPAEGTRVVPPMGHVRMVAAVQPFVSGAISKTINVPHEFTVEQVEDIYVQSWKLGTKCIALYRDGCKRVQPLNTSLDKKKEKAAAKADAPRGPVRRRLPDERQSITHKFSVGGHEGYITVGMYEDGAPGEIFITMAKQGSVVSGLMDTVATATSISLQYGVPIQVLVNKFGHTRFEPAGLTGNPDIPIAKSVIDYVFRWLGLKFLGKEKGPNLAAAPASAAGVATGVMAEAEEAELAKVAVRGHERKVFETQSDAPPCPDCGSIMLRSGTCYRCMNCGAQNGCS